MKVNNRVEEIPDQTEFIIPFFLKEFQRKDKRFKRGVPDLLTHKVLVNFKHDWDRETGKRAPIQWRAYIYGLMPGLQMSDGWKDLVDLAEESPTFKVIKEKWGKGERLLFIPTKEFDEAHRAKVMRLFNGGEISTMKILADIYYKIHKETGRTEELTTLSSCRNEKLTYLCCYTELDSWRVTTGNLIHLISANLNLLKKNPDPVILEKNLKRMALLHAQLEEKIRLFRGMENTKIKLGEIFGNYEFRELAFSIIDTMKPEPMSLRLKKMEEAFWIMKRYTSFLRYSLTMMNLAKDERPQSRKFDVYGKPKDLSWYINKLQEAFEEAQKSIDSENIKCAIEERNLEEYLRNIKIIYDQFKKWARRWIRESELCGVHEIDNVIEQNNRLGEDLDDLRRTAGIRKKKSPFAPVLVGDILYFRDLGLRERALALKTLTETLDELLQDYNVVDKRWVQVGADGFSVIFEEIASSAEAVILAMKIQHNLLRRAQEFPAELSIGIDRGEIAVYGAKPIDNYSLNAYYMTRDKYLANDGSRKILTSCIYITERIYTELKTDLKELCIQIGRLRDFYQRIGLEGTLNTIVEENPKFGEKDLIYIVKWRDWELENNSC